MRLRLFGSFQLVDAVVPLVHAKARALLTYLALWPATVHPRERLADVLWPEAEPERGRRALTQALYELRQSVGDRLLAEADTVRLDLSAAWQVDVWEFDQLAAAGGLPAWQAAAALYQGDLAPEIYDDWIVGPRLERREAYLAALEALAEHLAHQQRLAEALTHARQLVVAEPLRELNQQRYLRLLGRLGRRAEALAHYEQFQRQLQTELGLLPLPETRAILADLRREAEAPPPATHEALPLAGRAAERAALIQQLERLLGGQGGVLAIEGEPGLGKSRLLRELAASARWRAIGVLTAAIGDRPVEAPLAPLQAAFAALVTGPRRAQLELTLPAETLAACAPLVPAWQNRAALPELPPTHQRYRFHQALAALLAELTRFTPLLLILDDVQWADPQLGDVLAGLVQPVPSQRLLLVLTWRRAELEDSAMWPLVQAWERAGALTILPLQPLTSTEVGAALPTPYQAQAARLWAVSGGNPFLLTEALHALDEGRAPETGVAARARTLPAEARAALEAAAVLGRHVPLAVWAAATGLAPAMLTQLGDTLTQRYFLAPAEDGYAFTHDLVRAALYEALPPGERRRWHGVWAAALAALTPAHYRARAFHLDEAGQPEAAAGLYRQAGEHDQRLGAYAEARAALSQALAVWPDQPAPARAELALDLARLCLITQEDAAPAALEMAQQAAEAAQDNTLVARAALLAGELALKTGRHAEARAELERALEHAVSAGHTRLQAETYFQLGELALREGQMLPARGHYERQLALARQAGDQAQEAAALEGIGFALGNSGGDADEVIGYLRQALALRRAAGDRFKEAQSLLNLLATIQATGRLDEVLALGHEALSVNEAIGYARGAAIVRGTLAQVANVLGQFDEARALSARTREYFRQVNDPDALGLYTEMFGLIEDRAGHPERAEAAYREALALLESIASEYFAAFAQMDLGSFCVRAGRFAEAAPLLTQAGAVFAANGARMEHAHCQALLGLAQWGDSSLAGDRQALLDEAWAAYQTAAPEGEERQYYLWALWQWLLAAGRPEPASQVLQAAYATLQKQAALLTDDALRRSFFENVPVNRELAAAYARQSGAAGIVTVRLAHRAAPLGRALAPAEWVDVRWTRHAPEDDAVTDPAARRQFVLRRLLAEAEAQAAAPTDDDLARALGVSRRTILRDMRVLEQAGLKTGTRKRR